jgi:hypothetical protein
VGIIFHLLFLKIADVIQIKKFERKTFPTIKFLRFYTINSITCYLGSRRSISIILKSVQENSGAPKETLKVMG